MCIAMAVLSGILMLLILKAGKPVESPVAGCSARSSGECKAMLFHMGPGSSPVKAVLQSSFMALRSRFFEVPALVCSRKPAMLSGYRQIIVSGIMYVRFFTSLVVFFSLSAQADLYKWVDDSGVTHYTKTPPPESAVHDREILSLQGRKKGVIRGLIPEEEKRAEAERIAQEEARKELEEKERRRDRNLLISYKTIEEIEAKRDAKLAYLEYLISNLEEERRKSKQEYDRLFKEAVILERDGKAPGEDLKANLRSAQREYRSSKDGLLRARAEQDKTIQAFGEDIRRFKELRGGRN